MANNTTTPKGFVFYINSNKEIFYINKNKQHVLITDIKLIDKDSDYKQNILNDIKEYTYIGYNRKIQSNLFLYHDAIRTIWLSKKDFINKDKIFLFNFI